MKDHFSKPITGCLLAAIAIVPLVAQIAPGTNGSRSRAEQNENVQNNSAVLPINSKPYGKTYGEWSGAFWKWEFSLPVRNHPLSINSGQVDCSAGQSGPVWFLGGTFTTTPVAPGITLGRADRTCTIPPGKALFFPIVNSECSTITGDNLGDTTEAGLRQCATFFASFTNPNTLRARIDGNDLSALFRYNVSSPLFVFGPLPDANIFQFFGLTAPAGTMAYSVSDGVHLMVSPLSVGTHQIHFYGEQDFPDGSKFIQDITYHLTVAH